MTSVSRPPLGEIALCVAAVLITLGFPQLGLAAPLNRETQIQADIAALESEAATYGGWAAWHGRGAAYRASVATMLDRYPRHAVRGGHDGFLYTVEDLAYLTGDDLVYRTSEKGVDVTSPSYDVVTGMSRRLAQRGIELIFVPVPARFELYPEKIPDAPEVTAPLAVNRKFFIYNLLRAGVEAVDLLPAFETAKDDGGEALFHPANRHWSSAGIQVAAKALARRLDRYNFPEAYPTRVQEFELLPAVATPSSELIDALPEQERQAYRIGSWPIVRVLDGNRKPFAPDERSPVLIVGDSYVGHLAYAAAGIAAHLSHRIRIPVDHAWSRRGGPQVPRLFARKGPDYLKDRRVVIWIATVRSLSPYHDEEWTLSVSAGDRAQPEASP